MTANENELLRRYVHEGSEPAFEELVRAKIGLVYSAALRQLNGDVPAAEDVTQAVFIDLARKARRLVRHPSLTGWLYTSTRFLALKTQRAQQRRLVREYATQAMNEILRTETAEPDWATLRPILDEAMNELSQPDRDIVLWRYFEQLPFLEIGSRLGLKENAARMRVERALERLRKELAKRGIASTTGALASVLVAHGMEPLPAGIAERVSRTALASAAVGGLGVLLARLAGIAPKLAVGVAGLLLVAGIVVWTRLSPNRDTPASAPVQSEPTQPLSPAIQGAAVQPELVGDTGIPGGFSVEDRDLRIRITAAQGGQPVVEGEVYCVLETGPGYHSSKLHPDSAGVIQVRIPTNTARLRLVTQIDGYADTRLEWRPDRGEPIPREYLLRLTPGVPLGGQVVDAAQRPLSGATVQAFLEEPTTSPRPECHVAGFSTKTDRAGAWRISRVAPELVGNLVLCATHPDFATACYARLGVEPEAERQLRAGAFMFRLEPAGFIVCGTVVDPQGNALSGAKVRVGGLYEASTRTAQTGPDGWFKVAGCPAGKVSVTGEMEGFAPTTIEVDVGTNSGPLRLWMDRGKPLTVRVLSRAGAPLADASVNVGPDLERRNPSDPIVRQTFRVDRKTDTDGQAVFPSLPQGPLWVGASADGYILQHGVKVSAGGEELVLTLLPNLVVSGTVRDAVTGRPIPEFRIRTGQPEAGGAYFSDLDRFVLNFAGGEFRHAFNEPVSVGGSPNYLLRFEADGYAPFVSRVIAPEEGSAQLDVAMQPVSSRRISVYNPDGTPAAWTDVGLLDKAKRNALGLSAGGLERSQERTDGALQQTDGNGEINLPADGETHWVVIANQSGYLEANLDGIGDGGIIQLQPWARLEGDLPRPEGNSSDNEVWVQFVRPPHDALMLGMSFHLKPDEAGHFILPRVPPGRLMVFAGSKVAVSESSRSWKSTRRAQVELRAGESKQVTWAESGNER